MLTMRLQLQFKGGDIEVMGSLQGRVRGKEMIIMDSFELPVEGTETRVSAANEGYEYMVQYMTQAEQVQENLAGGCAQY